MLSVLERAVEVEFELGPVEILDLGRNLVFWQAVFDKKMSDQIQEDKRTSASAEGNVVTDWLQLESLAHWTLDCVSFRSVEALILRQCNFLSIIYIICLSTRSMDLCGKTSWLIVGFQSQIDLRVIKTLQELGVSVFGSSFTYIFSKG